MHAGKLDLNIISRVRMSAKSVIFLQISCFRAFRSQSVRARYVTDGQTDENDHVILHGRPKARSHKV